MKTILLALFVFGAASSLAQSAPVEVWAVPSIYKVRPDESAQVRNAVWQKQTRTVAIAGAKNEHIPFQIVVSAPKRLSRYDPPAAGFFVEVSDLVSPTARIGRERVKLYFEHVILCPGKSSAVGATGLWPDALAPLTDPFDMGAVFGEGVRNRGIWIDVLTPPDAPAGDYSGSVRVTQNGILIDELKLRLRVYDFALPAETHLITYMGVSADGLRPSTRDSRLAGGEGAAPQLPCLPLRQPHGAVVQRGSAADSVHTSGGDVILQLRRGRLRPLHEPLENQARDPGGGARRIGRNTRRTGVFR